MKRATKVFSLIMAVFMLVAFTAGCNNSGEKQPDPKPSTPDPAPSTPSTPGTTPPATGGTPVKDTLTIACGTEPPSMSTVDNDSLASIYIHLLTNNLLFRANMDTLEVETDLVDTYENISDTEWIFNLRKGVMFHHGKELKAEDVVASIENAKEFPATIPYTGEIKSVEIGADEYQVKITMNAPYSNLLYDLAYHFNYILPKDKLDEGHDFTGNPIGTGPYIFREWSKGNHIILDINENYWNKDEMPTIKTIIWKFIPEGTSRTLALEAGEVDVIYQVETADVERLKADDKFHVEEKPSMENFYMPINTTVAPFDDANLRLAIHCAIDRDAIIQGALNGYGVASYSSVPMGYTGSWEGNSKPYDVEMAKQYLAAWGGDPKSVTLPLLCRTDEQLRIGTIIQGNLAELDINVDLQSIDTATWHSRRAAGDYVAGITSWSPSNGFTYLTRYHSSKATSIPGALVDDQTDQLIDKMKKEMDDEKRLEVMHEIVERVNDLEPHVSLYQSYYFRVWDARLSGIKISATGYMQFHTAKWAAE